MWCLRNVKFNYAIIIILYGSSCTLKHPLDPKFILGQKIIEISIDVIESRGDESPREFKKQNYFQQIYGYW